MTTRASGFEQQLFSLKYPFDEIFIDSPQLLVGKGEYPQAVIFERFEHNGDICNDGAKIRIIRQWLFV